MLSEYPTPEDIFHARHFGHPLMPIGADPTPVENAALAAALRDYSKRSGPDDFVSLTGFLKTYPQSAWNAALWINLGHEYYNTGYYSTALDAWRQAWKLAKVATDLKGKAMGDHALGQLACMHARLGQMTGLDALLQSVKDRVLIGGSTENITGSREALWNMQKPARRLPSVVGPLALHRIKLIVDQKNPGTDLIVESASTQKGFSLAQVEELSKQLGLNFQMVFRQQNAPFIVPSVVHFKLDHYAALVRKEGDRFLLHYFLLRCPREEPK